MTVCPPKGSHTALNFDLMKADNNSLTSQDREKLKEAVFNIIIETSHQEYIKRMETTVNIGNIRKTFEGFHEFPKQYENGKLEISMSNNYGEIKTPWYGEDYKKDYYKEDKVHEYEIIITNEIRENVGSGSLVIQLDVDTREKEGWQEEVTFRKTSWGFKLHRERKSWADAETHCRGEGGHLASIVSEEDARLVMALAEEAEEGLIWLGGTDQEQEGDWLWRDGSRWNYEQWQEGGYGSQGDKENCLVLAFAQIWRDYACTSTYPFICQAKALQMTGKNSTTMTYTKNDLNFNSIVVRHSYQYNHQLLDSWDNARMTGFQLSWRMDHPPLEMTVSELGRSIKVPGHSIDRENYMSNSYFKTSLLFPYDIQDLVGRGFLVIKLEVETREKDGWLQFLKTNEGGESRLTYHPEMKTWADAEAHCQGEGGHLASVLTEEEQGEVTTAARGTWVWLGGIDLEGEGRWRWSDGSPWNYSMWAIGQGSRLEGDSCLMFGDGSKWWEYLCTTTSSFICQSFSLTITGKTNVSLSYTKEKLHFGKFTVWYKNTFQNKELLDSWEDVRMNGFNLSWYIKDINGSRLTKNKPDMLADWKPADADYRSHDNLYLAKMVNLASLARMKNMSSEAIIKQVLKEKVQSVSTHNLNSMCAHGQVKPLQYSTVFSGISLGLTLDDTKPTITNEDIKTGFGMFSAIVYCPVSTLKLYQFLHSLLSTQSPRTIIKATVNTIQSESLKEYSTRKWMNQFYLTLNKTYDFQYGKILLALSSNSQLEAMMAKDWPYFTHYTQQLEECLGSISCLLLQGLGNTSILDITSLTITSPSLHITSFVCLFIYALWPGLSYYPLI